MDNILPPFRPGYGTEPEVLAGRDEVIAQLRRALRSGLPVHHAFYGPRGVGKTVLLSNFAGWAAHDQEWHVVRHRLSEDQAVSEALVERLTDPARAITGRWGRLVDGLRDHLSIGWSGPGPTVSKELTARPAARTADTVLERALVHLGGSAAEAGTAVLLLLDEFHSPRPGPELVRLSQAMQAVAEERLPIHILVAGLRPPEATHTRGATFLERLPFSALGRLDPSATRLAFAEPLVRRGVTITPAALDSLVVASGGYPYFTQLFGAHTWEAWQAEGAPGPLDVGHTDAGLGRARAAVDQLYQGRLDRLSGEARRFVREMASIDSGRPVPIADIAARLGRPVTAISTVRQTLIERHQLVEPAGRGFLCFTLPWYGAWVDAQRREPGHLPLEVDAPEEPSPDPPQRWPRPELE